MRRLEFALNCEQNSSYFYPDYLACKLIVTGIVKVYCIQNTRKVGTLCNILYETTLLIVLILLTSNHNEFTYP
jgi:hypothetical protein